ncbi:hypothetical protein PC123_g3311 [Phytophthora cactorum]|nr:hypothetical protein PC123_g3311 [Phytophthora cactorum]
MSNTSADIVAVMSAPVATPWMTTWIKQYQPTSDTTVNSESDSDGGGFNLWLLGPILLSAVVASILIAFAVFRKRRRLVSVYFQRNSPAESECDSSRKSKPSGPLAAPRQRENRTSLRRTEQETIGEFNRTLRLPGEDDSPVAEPSPVSEEILPRPRRNTAPASRAAAQPSRGVQTNAPAIIASDFDPSNASVVSSEICCYRASIFYSDVSCSPVFGSRVEFCTASITRSGFYSSIIRSEFASTVRSGFFPVQSKSIGSLER